MDMITLTLMVALAGGNPGAISVVSQLSQEQLMALVEAKVQGPEIWVLYKDRCGEDMGLLKRVLDEAVQCGNLRDAVSRHCR